MADAPLRLLALDADDLAVISAALQDAVAKVGDIQVDGRGRVLTVAFNRFRWEAEGGRVRCGLQLGGVLRVKARNIRRDLKDAVISLLAVTFEPGEAPGGVVTLAFAGGGDIAVTVECVDAALADVSQPWRTPRRPGHREV